MNVWHDIDARRITPERFIAVVEITKGGKQKYEMDKETGLLRLDRILYTSTHVCGRRRPAGRLDSLFGELKSHVSGGMLSHRRHHHERQRKTG